MTNAKNSVRLHRVLKAPPERVYRAFVDPTALCKWIPPHGFLGAIEGMNASVGHGYRMTFTNFSTGGTHSFQSVFTELTPHERIAYTTRFEPPLPQGEMLVTVALRSAICGTSLEVLQEGIPEVIPSDMCYLGWQESLLALANLVEPDIPDGE